MNEYTIKLISNAIEHIDCLKKIGRYLNEEIDVSSLLLMDDKLTNLLVVALKEKETE